MKKQLAIAALILAAAVFGWWVKEGMHQANQTQVKVCTQVEDDFGDSEEVCEWKDEFHLGLFDGALPIGGFLIGAAALLLGSRAADATSVHVFLDRRASRADPPVKSSEDSRCP